ncbi:hypothetical protein [Pseudomonas sp. NCCP-436]|uniref:hypothetical protein n=1 Tax=Pseudomonas sp. NCCP-436 TaxID=2842481 RepID=UPI001DF3B8AE|nr:hypothetical protein [Pseudomonas sp. NCCP-436]GIZ13887.1 hypothetical protein NCCP436_33030 [Pseudomonas sp. NCCP-436]
MLDWLKERLDAIFKKINDFIDWIKDFFLAVFKWLQDAYDSFVDWLETFPQWVFSKIAEGIVSFFESIPVPDFFYTARDAFGSIPPEVVYFASMFRLDYGVPVVLLAFLIRFVIRRIPLIG